MLFREFAFVGNRLTSDKKIAVLDHTTGAGISQIAADFSVMLALSGVPCKSELSRHVVDAYRSAATRRGEWSTHEYC